MSFSNGLGELGLGEMGLGEMGGHRYRTVRQKTSYSFVEFAFELKHISVHNNHSRVLLVEISMLAQLAYRCNSEFYTAAGLIAPVYI